MAAELPSWKLQHLAVWQELVDVKSRAVELQDSETANVDTVEEEAGQSHFKALRAKIANLSSACFFCADRSLLVSVMMSSGLSC